MKLILPIILTVSFSTDAFNAGYQHYLGTRTAIKRNLRKLHQSTSPIDDPSKKPAANDISAEAALSSGIDQVKKKISSFEFSVDIEKIISNAEKAKENLNQGEFGKRGEAYFAAQAFIVLCILGGGVPVIGQPLEALFGPILLATGIVFIILGITDLGESLNPWPVPTDNTSLKKTGVYSLVRHPLYAGLVYSSIGLSIVTHSASRLILAAVLYGILYLKAEFEEGKLLDKFPEEYEEYIKEVPGRFIPRQVVLQIDEIKKKIEFSK